MQTVQDKGEEIGRGDQMKILRIQVSRYTTEGPIEVMAFDHSKVHTEDGKVAPEVKKGVGVAMDYLFAHPEVTTVTMTYREG